MCISLRHATGLRALLIYETVSMAPICMMVQIVGVTQHPELLDTVSSTRAAMLDKKGTSFPHMGGIVLDIIYVTFCAHKKTE